MITNNGYGIQILSAHELTIQNNTIANNSIGIHSDGELEMTYNNIQDNSQYSVYSSQANSNVPYNWWGTTDTQAINQSIYDNKNDLNLGTVNFVPFLTEPNPEAMPNSNPSMTNPTPTPTSSLLPTPTQFPSPTQSSSSSPSASQNQTASPIQSNIEGIPQAEFYEIIAIFAVIGIVLLLVIVALALRRRPHQTQQ